MRDAEAGIFHMKLNPRLQDSFMGSREVCTSNPQMDISGNGHLASAD
jgi:hypothetical protein